MESAANAPVANSAEHSSDKVTRPVLFLIVLFIIRPVSEIHDESGPENDRGIIARLLVLDVPACATVETDAASTAPKAAPPFNMSHRVAISFFAYLNEPGNLSDADGEGVR